MVDSQVKSTDKTYKILCETRDSSLHTDLIR